MRLEVRDCDSGRVLWIDVRTIESRAEFDAAAVAIADRLKLSPRASEDGDRRAADPRARLDQMAELVDEILRQFTVHGHPGCAAIRTPWLLPEHVQRWRRRRNELRPPDDPS